jgi:hypothetical protein
MSSGAGTIGDVNVRLGGDASGLDAAMKDGARAVEHGRERIGESLEEMSVVTERAAKKMEHLSIQMTFAANALAEGSERGVTRAAHGLAALGFVFGPAVGAVTTAAAIATERIVQFFAKAAEEAKKAREAFEAEIAKMANAGKSSELQQKQRELMFGTPFDEKTGKPRKTSEYVKGAFEGSLADLEAHYAALQAQLPRFATMAPRALTEEVNRVVRELDEAREKAAALQAAVENVASQPADMKGLLPTHVTAAKPLTNEELAANEAWLRDYYDAQTKGLLTAWEERQKIESEQGKKYIKAVEETHFEAGKSAAAATEMAIHELQKQAERNTRGLKDMSDAGAKYIKDTEDRWKAMFAGVTDAWNRTVERMRSGQDSLKNFWRDLWHEMVRGAIEGFLKVKEAKAAHWLAINAIDLAGNAKGIAISLAGAIAKIAHYAAVAAAATWSALAGIPYIGPFIAPVAAAAALAGVLALANGIGGGGGGAAASSSASAPAAGAGPPSASAASASAAQSGDVYHIYISAVDSQSMHQALMRNPASVAKAAAAGASQGARMPGSPGRGS